MSVEAAIADDVRRIRAPAVVRTAIRMLGRGWLFGSLTFDLPNGESVRLQGAEPGPEARLSIHKFRAVRRGMMSGDIGLAEGYMAGEWDTPDLAALLGVFSLNFDNLRGVITGGLLAKFAHGLQHALNANSRKGSRRNIHAHYDLGNAFYAQWLDESMTYSAARYERAGQDLHAAQINKYASLAKTMDLREGQSVLEIGCGWGGFAEFAAREVGARVTGVTISKAQHDFARQRLFDQGLADKADIRLVDYRDVTGQYDRVASIEMFEAVGERYWPAYFDKIDQILKPGGRAGLQIITILDRDFDNYRRRADFIQKYIFPGGMLIGETRLRQETDRARLNWTEIHHFGQDYADTLAEWRRRFDGAWTEIAPLGFDERFRRLWRFYLAYCEAGFRTERTNVIQLGLSKG